MNYRVFTQINSREQIFLQLGHIGFVIMCYSNNGKSNLSKSNRLYKTTCYHIVLSQKL